MYAPSDLKGDAEKVPNGMVTKDLRAHWTSCTVVVHPVEMFLFVQYIHVAKCCSKHLR